MYSSTPKLAVASRLSRVVRGKSPHCPRRHDDDQGGEQGLVYAHVQSRSVCQSL
jgi:hypothetical protein